MFDAIRANRRRSLVLLGAMLVLLVLLGGAIGRLAGAWLGTGQVAAQWWGAAIAGVLWGGQVAVALAAGRSILLGAAGARRVTKEDAPQLYNVVEEMTIASALPAMPDIHVIDSDEPNAFAVGTRPDRAAIAVTTGLLTRMDRDELQGVIAHEIGHVSCLDVRFMTIAGVLLGTIVMISDLVVRGIFRGAFFGGRRSSRKAGGALPLLVVVLVLAVLAPILARLLYFACSRRREYLADACAAQYTRFPEGLARALEKISASATIPGPGGKPVVAAAGEGLSNRVLAPMCIVNPLQGRSLTGLFSTHPPTDKRVEVLRAMGGGAGLADYRNAVRKVLRSDGGFLVGLGPGGRLAARPPSADASAARAERVARAREAMDLIDRGAGFAAVDCPCGVRVKIPPAFDGDEVGCVRCGRTLAVPRAAADPEPRPAAVTAVVPGSERPLFYRRKGKIWESFRCVCGGGVQISPSFAARSIECRKCRRQIRIDPPPAPEPGRGGG